MGQRSGPIYSSRFILFSKKQEILRRYIRDVSWVEGEKKAQTLKDLKENSSMQGFLQNGAPMPKKTLMSHKCGYIWLFN